MYVNAVNSYLSLDGHNIVLSQKDEEDRRIPLHNLEGIVTFGYAGASPALMGYCAEKGINLTFMTAHGRFLARIVGEKYGNKRFYFSRGIGNIRDNWCSFRYDCSNIDAELSKEILCNAVA